MGTVVDGSATAAVSEGILKLKSEQVDEAVIESKKGSDLAFAMNEGGKLTLNVPSGLVEKRLCPAICLEDAKSDNVHFFCTRFKERTECSFLGRSLGKDAA